jgi:hypothetical protein
MIALVENSSWWFAAVVVLSACAALVTAQLHRIVPLSAAEQGNEAEQVHTEYRRQDVVISLTCLSALAATIVIVLLFRQGDRMTGEWIFGATIGFLSVTGVSSAILKARTDYRLADARRKNATKAN